MSKEIISIHIGQAGIQVGNSCWELFCLEHGIQLDGTMVVPENQKEEDKVNSIETHFSITKDGKYRPRSIFVDLEPTAINKIRTGPESQLYSPEYLLSDNNDAGSIFARGYHSAGQSMIDICLDRIRKIVEDCRNLEGFIIYHSVGGGTGSGFGSLLQEKLKQLYSKKISLALAIYPYHKLSDSFVDPYNQVLATHSLIENTDICVTLDNEAIYNISKSKLKVETPKHKNLNYIIASTISDITAAMRFDGCLNRDLTEVVKNLVVNDRYKFQMISFSPFASAAIQQEKDSIYEYTQQVFQPDSMLTKCDPHIGKYISMTVSYRGYVIPKFVSKALADVKTKRTIRFVDWTPNGFRCGINYSYPKVVPGSDLVKDQQNQVCMLFNSTAVAQLFQRSCQQFDKMYDKKAFLHWYFKEGMEEATFTEAREDLATLQADYLEAEKDNEDVDEDAAAEE